MARIPLLQLNEISLTFGGDPVFENLSMIVQPGDRLALVGRNGSGKSTLMKVAGGLVEPDKGEVIAGPGVSVGYMEQDPDLSGYATLGDFASATLREGELYKVERAGEGLKFDPARAVETASGGERRRAALARLMAEEPELMLLDEPTNHLDIEAIGWLENELKQTRAGFMIISHDRAFLRALTRATMWIDRGVVRRQEKGFEHFEEWRDKVWEDEDMQRHKLNRKIKAEARWAVEGISARRKRNQGRVRALGELRAERASQINRQGAAAMALDAGTKSGRKVIEAEGITKVYGDKVILNPFDITVMRGDRIALVGPNGVGKTTLLNMMIGKETPDSGTIKLGTNLEIALFDQARAQLDPDMSLWDSLTGDPDMRVSGKADQVMVRGAPKHVIGYLKEFLFDEAQARAPVRSLSGGEKARLLLAKIMAKPSNMLVLDEPTNDLDVETLDLLQDLLGQYDGTVLLVSHDRDFLDRVAVTTIALEGKGKATVYAGGWSDYMAQRDQDDFAGSVVKSKQTVARETAAAAAPAKASGLSFTEKHRLEALPKEIARLEAEIAKLEELMSDPELFTREPVKFQKATEALVARHEKLQEAEEEWLLLEEKADA
ncbi:ABC-F family ATP-binding cassette domain-containing protein [Pseudosulfitobacter pseudonitzschiae]|uniref:ABC-F family ATP-binding cassette domain-containing protein n=1 Tax=Pseudosulfitobacter pseudonitzschiae TaxID=1402135 RepID=UPI001AF39E8F|nr:ATP-binding cassette domain-containing protein [Pseudosulfitobacter pseudonitzschiae]MBM1814618.1 ATP-binding cassette domain-containing protein [Pseudosulfitobacter pseudonitzschiae]MBM1831612.1 ATP-binding cassette domain-containing protein [Pseudosulfitobacter pseudonitzschiae]MBM1836477.1 ATP-binding cassette domain-containing protein [Pseudosulfitobacter pseudonitzschiae]MBM1841324.1 ATP-binding cassette domain-containing protein [Pseudosulfitobacter pseudonitzschiae]MBM1846191.1 ATP-b